ncbi:MAG: transcription-repair coupling factor [Holosporales bacterium]|jgi:transcription-repair coupling factor (superfamily II helicase)|nr:transcription-repair coupling factor [Holosporales bacterium]
MQIKSVSLGKSPETVPFIREIFEHDSIVFVLNKPGTAKAVASLLQQTVREHEVIPLDFFDVSIYENSICDCATFERRAASLTKILTSQKKVVVATIEALNYKVPPPSYFLDDLEISVGDAISLEALINRLVTFGYRRSDLVVEKGYFAVRGGIIDVFPPLGDRPKRIDFFGSDVESIREFDADTQVSISNIKSIRLTKCSEIIMTDDAKHMFRQKFRLQNDRALEAVENGNMFPGIEWYLSCFHDKTVDLSAYFPDHTRFILDFEVEKHNAAFFEQATAEYEKLQYAVPAVTDIFHDFVDEIPDKYEIFRVSPFDDGLVTGNISTFQEHNRIYNIRREADLKAFTETLRGRVIISVKTRGALNVLQEIMKAVELKQVHNFFDDVGKRVGIVVSCLNCGFITDNLTVYTEKELFGGALHVVHKGCAKNLPMKRSRLSVDDYVVHKKHGIAIFEGLVTLDVSGVSHDFLSLRYKDNDKLYVPVENVALISRYGGDDVNVALDVLKSGNWLKRRLNVRKKLLVIANNLLKTAAKRQANKIQPFEIPDDYDAFCNGFGHIETEDQTNAINDVLDDLRGDVPMDRLICGDVGFGKTEVALRAAFVVASSLKQVVLLVPTTILASQHHKVFRRRFDKFGVRMCQLSRFTPKAQMNENITAIANGDVQIIIATHSVLSEKIKFLDLGLVIVDEEQHFGVHQKEFLKQFNTRTHFMTLSATPIPRTLQLAMSGVKDLSMITTAPMNRMPVKTIVCDFTSDAIKNAIEAELKLGGQVFFVVPRIEYLDGVHELVSKLLPELNVQKAHGKTSNLEQILVDFCDHQIDVLVSTNIIDSGIDIPNANTILIYRVDLFGLSQLYQLRGRVGRSKRQAYAYLLLEPRKILTEAAKKRLDVLHKLNKLGSGVDLASYDMDIRGAGNLLGEEQSGYIKEVGVELYQSMLQEAILMLKADPDRTRFESSDPQWREPQINLGVSVFIHDTYIEDSALRLEIYRKIGSLNSDSEIDDMEFELSDRFGKMPQETRNLLDLMRIKISCKAANIDKLDVVPSGILFSFDKGCNVVNFGAVISSLSSGPMSERFTSVKLRPDRRIVLQGRWRRAGERTKAIDCLCRFLASTGVFS